MAKDSEHLIWIDLEMTGLRPDHDRVIEIATLITDKQLSVIAEGPELVIHQDDEILDGMDDWNTRQHGGSGLTERVRASRVSEQEAEQATLAFLGQHMEPATTPMSGNSICQDRGCVAGGMPELEVFVQDGKLDVSTN